MPRYAYEVWDVFTTQPLTGNPLSVVTDARGLSDVQMQAIARETNHSETTFLLPPRGDVRTKGHRVRIFSPTEEYPFAGHPVLGSAAAIRQRIHEQRIVLDLNVGPVPVDFDAQGFGEMTQPEPEFTAQYTAVEIAPILGLKVDDIDPRLPIETVSTGRPNVLVPIKTLRAIRSMKINWQAAGSRAFYFLSLETEDPKAKLHARKISARAEDPATGSAAGCAAAWIVKHGFAKPDERILIEQGGEMARPSQIFIRAAKEGDRITRVRVGGGAVMVARGEFLLP